MRRVAVLGCGGAGKTTVARAIAAAYGLPVWHVDIAQRGGGTLVPESEWWAEHDALIERDAWVIDAMKPTLLPHRLAAAETAVFLDLPRRSCLLGLLQRRLRYRGRIDVEAGVVDRLNVPFLRWVWGFRRTTRPQVLKMLAEAADTTDVVTLTSRRAVRAFLAGLPAPAPPAPTPCQPGCRP